jgi:outer membrane protein TolC
VFKQQVIATVSSIVNLYADLVAFTEDVRVRRQALAYAEKLYNDNRKQVEIGTLAPIEIVKAEAEVAARQQDLTVSETQLLQQETIVKNALSKTGVRDPQLAAARIVPTDRLEVPTTEAIQPLQDLVDQALRLRPELEQTRINIQNTGIALAGSRSQLLPSLNVVVGAQNNALAGQISGLHCCLASSPVSPTQAFLGGGGTLLNQLFGRKFPDYNVGVQLNIPLRNRTAIADVVRDQLSLRQAEINQQIQANSIRVNVSNAVVGLQQARARYAAAQKSRQLQEQSLDAEQKKYSLGASTIFFVIQAQRDLATAQGNEVQALANYNRAKVQLAVATGTLLEDYRVSLTRRRRVRSAAPRSRWSRRRHSRKECRELLGRVVLVSVPFRVQTSGTVHAKEAQPKRINEMRVWHAECL